MHLQNYFTEARNLIQEQNFNQLKELQLEKPEYFNWVEEIFYDLNVKNFGNQDALIWRYNEKEKRYSYREMYEVSNQLLNLLRKNGVQQGDRMYSMLPLVPANWISFVATIKGGFIMMPAPTNLTSRDLMHRFESLFPEVFVTDIDNAPKIDEAEKDFGKKIKVKVCVGGSRDGWVSFDDLMAMPKEAQVASTKSDDPVLYFFTSGTTGLPKIVVHTPVSYTHLTLPTTPYV